jgi:hypothetical protein
MQISYWDNANCIALGNQKYNNLNNGAFVLTFINV